MILLTVEEDLRILMHEIQRKEEEEEENIARIANLNKQEEVSTSSAIVSEKSACNENESSDR